MPSYTINELLNAMAPQSRRDKALIGRCVEGLGLYAAQVAEENKSSSKIGEIRKLAENLVGYWGLGFEGSEKSAEDFMQSFDDRVDEARTGGLVTGDVYQTAPNVIYGLHRYGEDLVVSQGAGAMNDILDTSDLMKEIGKRWNFEPDVGDDLTKHLEGQVQGLLESTPFPGKPLEGVVNAGYVVTRAVLYENDRGFALAQSITAPNVFVTWQFTNDTENGKVDYHWGRYQDSEQAATVDYVVRATEYQRQYGLKEKPLPLTAFGIDEAKSAENSTEPGIIPVRVTTETQPLVTVTFSECDQLRGIIKMPLYLANTVFFEADEQQQRDFANLGSVKQLRLKTDFLIDFIKDGNSEQLTGCYHIGDGDGTLTEHILDHAEYSRLDEAHQEQLANQGVGIQAVENARLNYIAGVLIPIFDKHCEISAEEEWAVSELMGIYKTTDGHPADSDTPRIAYLESVVDYAGRCREALNATGLNNLPEAPTEVLAEAASSERQGNSPAVVKTSKSSEKPSVLDEIRESRSAPKASAESKPERDKIKKNNQPEY
ncbi:MAG: hypothetical protein FWF81_12975 [Defluviitaleaceae bacterium]|nr:hypothetical protein [Defluviitaleaceae bacterium]